MDMIFRIGLAILQTSQEELTSQDMEGMLNVSLKYKIYIFFLQNKN